MFIIRHTVADAIKELEDRIKYKIRENIVNSVGLLIVCKDQRF